MLLLSSRLLHLLMVCLLIFGGCPGAVFGRQHEEAITKLQVDVVNLRRHVKALQDQIDGVQSQADANCG